ncbi:hypothetical protein HDU93_007756, partial [Gonapodya sp. JEL0774]
MSFKSAPLFASISTAFSALPESERAGQIKKINANFLFNVKSAAGAEKSWFLDMKKSGTVEEVASGASPATKPDITISIGDDTFVELVDGKTTAQKAFMTGKVKVKGNMMLAMKLDSVLKVAKNAAPAASPPPKAAAPSTSGSIEVPGFKSSQVFIQLKAGIDALSAADQEKQVKNVKNVFKFDVKNSSGQTQSWLLDLKSGPKPAISTSGATKPDITIAIGDADFVDLALGKLNAQKAYMSGKLKVKGNLMAA